MLRKVVLISLICLFLIGGSLVGTGCGEKEITVEKPTTPPSESPVRQPQVELLQNTLRRFSSEGTGKYSDRLIGEVQNVGNAPAYDIGVTATFYDERGYIVDQKTSAAVVNPLLPGEKCPIITAPFPYINYTYYDSRYTLSLSWETEPKWGLTAGAGCREGFEILNFKISKDYYGFWKPEGEVLNIGDKQGFVYFLLTFYDNQGKVLAYSEGGAGPLIPNQVSTFGFDVLADRFGLDWKFEFFSYSLMITGVWLLD